MDRMFDVRHLSAGSLNDVAERTNSWWKKSQPTFVLYLLCVFKAVYGSCRWAFCRRRCSVYLYRLAWAKLMSHSIISAHTNTLYVSLHFVPIWLLFIFANPASVWTMKYINKNEEKKVGDSVCESESEK